MKRSNWFRCTTPIPARIDVVHPGVDLEMFTPGDKRGAAPRSGSTADEPVLAFVGRIQPLKAPDVLLRAAAKLPGGAGAGGGRTVGQRAGRARRAGSSWPTNWVSPTG